MPEYRPVTDDHRIEFRGILQQAFDPEQGPTSELPVEEIAEQWPPELCDPRGLFVGDELVAVCKLYWLEATVRGEWTSIGGFGGVATPPEHRRNGYARQLLREALREYREAGVDLVVLWPATVRFYQQLGWGTANRVLEAELPPAQLSKLERPADGRIRQLDRDDWERLRPVETERAERIGLSLRRTESWWRERTLGPWPDEPAPYVYGYEREGEIAGYVLTHLRSESGEDGRLLDAQDLAAADRDAERALLGFLGDHDSQASTVRLSGPLARDVLEFVPDPDAVDVTIDTTEGPMARLADVQRGLSALSWPASASAELVLSVEDPLLDRNDEAFRLDVSDGEATVEPAAADAAPDAALDVGTLSRLAVGALETERAIDLGAIEVRDGTAGSAPPGEVRDALAAAFPTEPVYLREFF